MAGRPSFSVTATGNRAVFALRYCRALLADLNEVSLRYRAGLLICSALVFEPSRDMTAGGIVVGPVDEAALGVPDILAEESDRVPFLQTINTRCEFDVVLDQDRPAGCESQDEPLMGRTFRVVRQDPRYDALALDLNIASALLGCTIDRRVAYGRF